MRIQCEDGGYLEFQRSKKPHHIHVIVAARNPDNHLQLRVNTAEVLLSDVLRVVQSVTGPLRLDEGQENETNNQERNPDDFQP